jgi:glycerol-3-phosphate dehydrogenase
VRNGVSLRLGERVCALNHVIDPDLTSDWLVRTSSGVLRTRVVINAAGLASDAIDRMAGYDRFTITARRGQLMVFDKMARPVVNHIVLPVPTKLSKGVLVAPTVFGNVMLGPTAEDLRDFRDSSSTADGVEYLLGHGQRIMPSLVEHEVTAIYAGLRAATEHTDYQFFIDGSYVCVGGIRSTGLTASMSIAEDVVAMLDDYGLRLVERPDGALCDPASLDLIWLGEDDRRGWCTPVDGAHGTLVCHCEKVSAGELDRAMHAVVPARDLEGLRRRTRALAGRCQGFYCLSEVTGRLADATGSTISQLLGTMTGENRDRRESQ